MKHVAALDGVRGMAILMVIAFHFGYVAFGWAGVQVFFVLSGYLITSVLLSDDDLPFSLYLVRFYWRRTLRIFPLYFLYLGLVAIVYSGTGRPALFGRYWPSLLTYTFNLQQLAPSYQHDPIFGHFWSLCIEEQFYLCWPLLIYCVCEQWRARLAILMIASGPVVRTIASGLLMHHHPDQDYVGMALYGFTLSHFDAFAIGALLAIRRKSMSPLMFGISSAALLLCGAAAAWLIRGNLPGTSLGYSIHMMHGQQIWGYSIINIWAATMIGALLRGGWLTRFFAWGPIAYVGKISYGMYVYHVVLQLWIVGMLGRRGAVYTAGVCMIYVATVLVVSSVSYYGLETRLLRMKDRKFRRPERKPTAPIVVTDSLAG